jgi:coenzyme F420 hydrogenase subunit beta
MSGLRTIEEVMAARLCLGCGACAYASGGAYEMLDDPVEGLRPRLKAGRSAADLAPACLAVCPVVEVDFGLLDGEPKHPELTQDFLKEWGPITKVWEGHASDPEIRFQGSSGGVLTAIAAFCLEKAGMTGALHIRQSKADPIRNVTQLSRTRAELLSATGSRYAPASVCEKLGEVEHAEAPCVVIGKPVEIAATRKATSANPALAEKVGVTLSFYCAESPPTAATSQLLSDLGVDAARLEEIRYRGEGWPGNFSTRAREAVEKVAHLTYRESWAFLQSFRPWSTQIWPDGGGELADISCGDPWYEEPDGINPGFSLVVARTGKGVEIVEGAIAAGYLTLRPAELWKIPASQKGLLNKKGSVWGRRLAMRALGMPVTRFKGLDLRHCWGLLPANEKFKSVVGTLRRILQRQLRKPYVLKETPNR